MITDELNDIKKYIEEGEMSFLVGAGFSRNVNKEAYPLWGGLLKDAIWNMFGEGNRTKQKEKKVLEKVEKEYGYLGFASMMVNKAGYHESIDTYIESKTPFIKTIGDKPVLLLNGKQLPNTVHSDAHLLLKNLNIQNIYTFNYDNALEFFMGEDAKRMLEKKIKNSESSIESLKKEISDLDQKERSLGENNEGTNPASQQLNQELEEIQRKKNKKTSELSELRAGLETDKWNLRTYYNVVKDSSEISLSAKRKSIYKIHGSLRENPNAEYGFDGDTHAQYIITKEDYDAYNEKHGAFVSMMRIDLLRNRFCIIGVSGGDANFLAWINWVKDVLDNTEDRVRQGKENQHQSYFIYSGNNDMPEDLVLMLKNHFIQPVILKNVFPKSQSDEERIKLFLEYVQPLSNNDSAKFSKLWNEINVPKSYSKSVDKVSITVAEELFRLSSCNKYNGPHSTAQYVATDVQFEANHYLNDATPRSERLVYAAALQSTLMPVDLTCDRADFIQMDKETGRDIIAVFRNACRRAVLLQHLSGKGKKLAKEDKYTFLLYNLYDFRFPTKDEVLDLDKQSGIDFVRRYSLLKLLQTRLRDAENCDLADFKSTQELILATDWLKYIGYRNPALYRKAEEFKQQERLLSLYDYCHAFLRAMRRNEEIDAYGDNSRTVYIDKYTLDETNASILLNSFVELGICFSGQSPLSDLEWLEVVKALKRRYPVALAFYTITRGGKDKVVKIVAQELMYDDVSRRVLPSLLKSIIVSLVSESTPVYLKGNMALFAKEILPAVDQKHWSRLFVPNAITILDIADSHPKDFVLSKCLYGFVASALEYLSVKELRLKLLKRIFENMDLDDQFGSYYNTLAISARERLKQSDFASLYNVFVSFVEKTKANNNQQALFVVVNLLVLLDKEHKTDVLKLIEHRAVRDPFLIGGYVSHIKGNAELENSFVDVFLKREDLWNTGIDKDGIHVGSGNVSVSKLDKLLRFNKAQVAIIYNSLKLTLDKIDKVFQRRDHSKEDRGWMSLENIIREPVMDMRLFVHRHQKYLLGFDGFEETKGTLVRVYEQCFFEKNTFQLIADNEIYRAIRRIMFEVELQGMGNHQLEYEQLIGRLMTKDTKELNVLFQHISWAINHFHGYFDKNSFKKLLSAVLHVYQPFFEAANGDNQTWDLKGCQKEEAEKALLSISKTMEKWGVKDDFWSQYKRTFYLR